MLTGGFKTWEQAQAAVSDGIVDVVGLARTLALEPSLPNTWKEGQHLAPVFPRFTDAPEGGGTAWYTMRLTEIGNDIDYSDNRDLVVSLKENEIRDSVRTKIWQKHFASKTR